MATDRKQAQPSLNGHIPSVSTSNTSSIEDGYSTSTTYCKNEATTRQHAVQPSLSELEDRQIDKALVRKLDLCVMPVLVIMCAFTVIDKLGVR